MSKATKIAIGAVVMILIAISASFVPALPVKDPVTVIKGSVTVNGLPRSGIQVTGLGLSTTTDSNGNYQLGEVANGCIGLVMALYEDYSSSQLIETTGASPELTVNLNINIPDPTSEPTATPVVTPSATPVVTPVVTPSATPVVTPSAKPTAKVTVTPGATPKHVPSPTPKPTATSEAQPTPPPIPTPEISPTPAATPLPTGTPAPSATPTTEASPTPPASAGTTGSQEPTARASSSFVLHTGSFGNQQFGPAASSTPSSIVDKGLTGNNSSEENTTAAVNATTAPIVSRRDSASGTSTPSWSSEISSKRSTSGSPGLPLEAGIIALIFSCVAYVGFVAYSMIRKG